MYDIPALILWVEITVYGNYDCLLTACHSQAIGVTSSDAIPDGSFSASSKANNERGPSAGRLNGDNRGWSPETNTNHADYLQIDLQYDYVICAVATQGSVNNDQWTTKYKIKLSLDGVTFNTYKENKTEKVSLILMKHHAKLAPIFFSFFDILFM